MPLVPKVAVPLNTHLCTIIFIDVVLTFPMETPTISILASFINTAPSILTTALEAPLEAAESPNAPTSTRRMVVVALGAGPDAPVGSATGWELRQGDTDPLVRGGVATVHISDRNTHPSTTISPSDVGVRRPQLCRSTMIWVVRDLVLVWVLGVVGERDAEEVITGETVAVSGNERLWVRDADVGIELEGVTMSVVVGDRDCVPSDRVRDTDEDTVGGSSKVREYIVGDLVVWLKVGVLVGGDSVGVGVVVTLPSGDTCRDAEGVCVSNDAVQLCGGPSGRGVVVGVVVLLRGGAVVGPGVVVVGAAVVVVPVVVVVVGAPVGANVPGGGPT